MHSDKFEVKFEKLVDEGQIKINGFSRGDLISIGTLHRGSLINLQI